MSEERIREIADSADLVVDGYAMLPKGSRVTVVHLYTGHVAVVDEDQGLIESSMDDLEELLALRYLEENRQFLVP